MVHSGEWMKLRDSVSQDFLRGLIMAIALFSLLALAIFWRYSQGVLLVGTDSMGLPTELEMMKHYDSFFSTWQSFASMGTLQYPSPVLAAFYYLSVGVLNISPLDLSKTLLVLSFWLSGVLMYVCAYRITRHSWGSILAAVVYSFNQVFLSQITEGHYFLAIGFAVFPLLFLIYYQALNGGRVSVVLLPVAASIFGMIAAPHSVLMAASFLLLFTATFIILERKKLLPSLPSILICLITFVVLILPFALMKFSGMPSLDARYTLEEATALSSPTLLNAFIASSTENTFISGTAGGYWTVPGIVWPLGMAVAMIVPILAFLALNIRSKRKLVIALLVPAILFMVIAKGPAFPMGEPFSFLFVYGPLLDTIRAFSRFLMFTGFSYALLIAIVMANFSEFNLGLGMLSGPWKIIRDRLIGSRQALAAILVIAMLFPSAVVFSGIIQGYDLPTAYSLPYEWLNEDEGDYRILNLPYREIYTIQNTEGYPPYKALDVGRYSPLIGHKDLAYGTDQEMFWAFVANSLDDRTFGYKNLSSFLGSSASVKYVVSQAYADEEESRLFLHLNGMREEASFSGGGAIFGNDYWLPRVHAMQSVVALSGERSSILPLIRLGLVDPQTTGIIMIDRLEPDLRELVISTADRIIISDSGLVQFMVSFSQWSNERIDLQRWGNGHSNDSFGSWIVSNSDVEKGIASISTIETTGPRALRIPTRAEASGSTMLIKTMHGPDGGTLNVSLDGIAIESIDLSSPFSYSSWTILNDAMTEGSHEIILSNDGRGRSSIEQLLVVPSDELDARMIQAREVLIEHKEKVVYLIGVDSPLENGFVYQGSEGKGWSNTLYLDARNVSGDSVLVADPSSSNGAARYLDGGSVLADVISTFGTASGREFNLTFMLRSEDHQGEEIVCRIGVWSEESKEFLVYRDIQADEFVNSYYREMSLNFTGVNGKMQFRAVGADGSTPLYFDFLTVSSVEQSDPVRTLFLPDSEYDLKVAQGGSRLTSGFLPASIEMEGRSYALSDQSIQSVHVGELSEGDHQIIIRIPNFYGMAIMPIGTLDKSSPSVIYERKSTTDYSIQTSSNEPFWLYLSESYHPFWEATIDGEPLEHVPVDSISNAFYVPGGNNTVLLHFRGQDVYPTLMAMIFLATIVATTILVVSSSPRFRSYLRP